MLEIDEYHNIEETQQLMENEEIPIMKSASQNHEETSTFNILEKGISSSIVTNLVNFLVSCNLKFNFRGKLEVNILKDESCRAFN